MAIGKLYLQGVTCATVIERVVHVDDVDVHNKFTLNCCPQIVQQLGGFYSNSQQDCYSR